MIEIGYSFPFSINGTKVEMLRLTGRNRPIYETAQMLGHVDVQTTQQYAHIENRDIGLLVRDIIEKIGFTSVMKSECWGSIPS